MKRLASRYRDPLRVALLGVWLASLGACAPEVSGPVELWVVSEKEGSDALQRAPAVVEDLQALHSSDISVLIGGYGTWPGENAYQREGARRPFIDARLVDGAYLAADLDGLAMASYLAHFQGAHTFYRSLGLGQTVEDLPPMNLVLFEIMPLGFSMETLGTDNAAYDGYVREFIGYRQSLLKEGVVLWAHPGVVTHELGHGVVDHLRTWSRGGVYSPSMSGDPWGDLGWAIDEGAADLFAALYLQDPRPTRTAGVGEEGGRRDLSADRRLTRSLVAELEDPTEDFDPYDIGDVLASALWDYRAALIASGESPEEAGRIVGTVVFEFFRTAPEELGTSSDLAVPVELIAKAIAARGEIALFCPAVQARFQILLDRIPSCAP